MTNVFTDGSGFAYLGDARYANHNVGFALVDYLLGCPITEFSQGLTDLLTASGVQFRNVVPQSTIDNDNGSSLDQNVFTFGANSDTIDDRYTFNYLTLYSATTLAPKPPSGIMYNNLGYSNTNNVSSSTNGIFGINLSGSVTNTGSGSSGGLGFRLKAENNTFIQIVGVSNPEFVAIFLYQHNLQDNNFKTSFYYAGTLDNNNTNFNYYSENIITRSILMTGERVNGASFHTVPGAVFCGHRIALSSKRTLETGDAQYSFVCSDGQTPSATWLSDMYVFDNNATLGFPAMGRVRGMLLGTGTFTIGKPVKITGSVVPDSGSRWYLPIGSYAGKTVLMKCYSSVDL